MKNYIFLFSMFINLLLTANGVQITTPSLINRDITANTYMVQFSISWQNSWKISTGAANYDACWVFVKFRKKASVSATFSDWKHATFSTTGNYAPTTATLKPTADGKGCFIYASANFAQANVSYSNIQLKWKYGADLVADNDIIDFRIYAIEMVYVPSGAFYVGDGGTTSIQGNFEVGKSNTPFQITSESSITLGGGGSTSLGNNNAIGMATPDDFNDATAKTLPAAFPKGFAAFYMMKYEVTQEQYVEFLNKLTRTQQSSRIATAISTSATSVTNRFVMSYTTAVSARNGIRCNASIPSNSPITFYCDLSADGVSNETDDGQSISCNYLGVPDMCAYLDWSALRPMTELEFEKACRGNQTAVANEFAWGTATATLCTGISNAGTANEVPSNASANTTAMSNFSGPTRVGCFGNTVNSRVSSGASYYGIMDLSGNNWERPVSVGDPTARLFTALNGDGCLSASGTHNVLNWPDAIATGCGYKGGRWRDSGGGSTYQEHRVSNRQFAVDWDAARSDNDGIRGVRKAE